MAKIEIALGIDIGGTNTTLGFVTRKGTLVAESKMLTQSHEPAAAYVVRLHAKIKEMQEKINETYELKGIGVGAPNANYYKGTVEYPPNLKWEGVTNLAEMIQRHYQVPVAITNDANAAAIGEMKFGAAKGMKHFIVITLGTGLGSGIVVDGKMVYGHDGFAGELGHTIVNVNGRFCGCGRRGCLETYVSAGGICRTVFELLAERKEESELRSFSFNQLTSKMISDAAQHGDKIALEAFDLTGKILGIKLADAVAHTSPEAIILFGGLSAAGELLLKPTQRYMEEYMLNIFKGKVRLLPSGLLEGNAAVLGASALIWNELDTQN
jgi:glucokinase